jgi:biotin operon repressor
LGKGAIALYATRQALRQAKGVTPKRAALSQALNVSSVSVSKWSGDLKNAGLGQYESPDRAYVLAPVSLLIDPQVSHQAKVTALHLLTCANGNTAQVSLSALVSATGGRSESSLQRDIQKLGEQGHLSRKGAPYSAELGKREGCNTYTFKDL